MSKAYESFEAIAFHPDLGDQPLEGTLFFSALTLTFRGDTQTVEIPLSQLLVRFDDASDGRILFQNSQQPDWTLTTHNMAVLEQTSVAAIAKLREELSQRLTRQEIGRRIKQVVWFCAGCTLVLWLGMVATGAMVRSIAGRVSPEAEKKHGDALLEELATTFDFLEKSNEVNQLTALAQPLLQAGPAEVKWDIRILKEESPNAFAIPGGHIIVTEGLLKLATRPEELLGPMAHEMAHVTRKHAFRQRVASAGPLLILQIFLRGRSGLLVTVVGGGSALLVNQSFSQEYEKEADDTGWEYLVKANIDPRGMIDMFRKLKTADGASAAAALPKACQSHPDLDKRINRLERKWRRLSRKSGFLQLES